MNWHAVRSIYFFEMARTRRTLLQSVLAPVITTTLYFVVFGSAIGARIPEVEGVSYGAFIVPPPRLPVRFRPRRRARSPG